MASGPWIITYKNVEKTFSYITTQVLSQTTIPKAVKQLYFSVFLLPADEGVSLTNLMHKGLISCNNLSAPHGSRLELKQPVLIVLENLISLAVTAQSAFTTSALPAP